MNVAMRLLGMPGQEDLEVLKEGLCFIPVTGSGRPIVSRVPDESLGNGLKTRGGGDGGVFVSAGHGPWGECCTSLLKRA
jgi:glycine/D-amino acid oxidase-like deaminating enzyme